MIQCGTCDYGVVPFENSTNGAVSFTLDLLADQRQRHPDVLICGETYIPVNHCLLGRRAASTDGSGNLPGKITPTAKTAAASPPSANPNAPLSHITRIFSHPQAWGQCKGFLTQHFKGVDQVDTSSTSAAASAVANDESGTSAALCSALAAKIYGLDILAKQVEDSKTNTTRFLILRKVDQDEHQPGGIGRGYASVLPAQKRPRSKSTTKRDGALETPVSNNVNNHEGREQHKSCIAFTVPHSTHPGALASTLSIFATKGINLTSINTRPSGQGNWHYIFFVEFAGRAGDKGAVDAALDEVDKLLGRTMSSSTDPDQATQNKASQQNTECGWWRYLGSWQSRG